MSTARVLELRKPALQEFGQIFQEHYDLVYRTAYSITRTPEDAEDVAQTIFLQLLRRESLPDLAANPKGYFYRAAVNFSLKTIRSRQRQILTGDSNLFESAGNTTHTDGEEELDQLLWKAIAELNEGAAQTLILRYIHGYRLGEIAKMLGTTRSTVAVSLFRSRTRLKKLIRASQGENS
ncbi:MAG TPA: sigma-70 family RNA polymerase sigma factor [Terriglobia bacterium]|nr:sigma-70 family RNA polymerase sigma factor [Terriglobia bacterium]